MFFLGYFMENTCIVSVFKTNITSGHTEVCSRVSRLPGIRRCTLDAEDCDRVMRIESETPCMELVLATVRDLGFFIEEMPD